MARKSHKAPERVVRAFESLDAADLVPVEPPPFVWDGIDASVESGRAELPGSGTAAVKARVRIPVIAVGRSEPELEGSVPVGFTYGRSSR